MLKGHITGADDDWQLVTGVYVVDSDVPSVVHRGASGMTVPFRVQLFRRGMALISFGHSEL